MWAAGTNLSDPHKNLKSVPLALQKMHRIYFKAVRSFCQGNSSPEESIPA